MYRDTITLFCRYYNSGKMYWATRYFSNVDFNADRARIMRIYGENAQDRALLHIALKDGKWNGYKYVTDPSHFTANNKEFTLKSGKEFDFFVTGHYTVTPSQTDTYGNPIFDDDNYEDGFFNWANTHNIGGGNTYMITSAAEYSVIPHIEVTAR